MNVKSGIAMAIMLLLSITCLSIPAFASKPPPDAVPVGNETCLDCHDELGEAFAKTFHGIVNDEASGSINCESCHGSGSAHAEEGDIELIGNPAKTDQFGSSSCLNCHNTAMFDEWEFAGHNGGDVNCAGCHTIHEEPQPATGHYIQKTCFKCHSDVSAALHMPSHHPVNEGLISCIDCHAVHGGTPELAMDATGRELCMSCHPEKEGPFIYEHAPVSENCLVCHSPHGTVADNLLVQNEPTLCLSCHPMHFHATIPGWDGDFATPQTPERAGTSTPDGWKEGILTKCTQCHTEIHGSDLPSQAISTGGTGLTR